MLLSRDAISGATEVGVDTADFYKPAHANIYDAVMSLYGQGEPVDPVTVADELRRADLLDGLGGRQALLRLQAQTPASANATHYAKHRQRARAAAPAHRGRGRDLRDGLRRLGRGGGDARPRRVARVRGRRAARVRLDDRRVRRAAGHPRPARGAVRQRRRDHRRRDRLRRPRQHAARSPAVEPARRRGTARRREDRVGARRRRERGDGRAPAGHVLLDGDGDPRAHEAPPVRRVARRAAQAPDRQDPRGGVDAPLARGRAARRDAAAHRRQPALHRDGDARRRRGAPRRATATSGSWSSTTSS